MSTSIPTPPVKKTFVEETHLAMRIPQLQLPIRQNEWDHLRLLLRRCKSRERNFAGALWSAVSIAATSLFSTFGFMQAKDAPEWLMRTGISVTVAASAVAIVLAIINRIFRAERLGSVDDALASMIECERAFFSPEAAAEMS